MRKLRITGRGLFLASCLAAFSVLAWMAVVYQETRARHRVIEILRKNDRLYVNLDGPPRGSPSLANRVLAALGRKPLICIGIDALDEEHPPNEEALQAIASVPWPHLNNLALGHARLWRDGKLLLPRDCPPAGIDLPDELRDPFRRMAALPPLPIPEFLDHAEHGAG